MSPLLLPNFGAEEGEGRWSAGQAPPMLRPIATLWSHLFAAGARLVGDEAPPPWPSALGPRQAGPAFPWLEVGDRGVAWLPTHGAWRILEAAGVEPSMPAPEVVARVHDKAFALEVAEASDRIPACLEDLFLVLSPEELEAPTAVERIEGWAAALPEWVGGSWTLKPRLGSSGRGRISGLTDRGISIAERLTPAALRRFARRGGAIGEPWLQRRVDLSTQLHIAGPGSEVELLGTTRQILSPQGGYLGNAGLLDPAGRTRSASPFDPELREAGLLIGRAAAATGFIGPCGIDAFTFVGPDGDELLRPVVELNARFTMGTIVLGLLARARAAGLLEGMRSFRFLLWEDPELQLAPGVQRIPLGVGAALHLSPSKTLAG